MSEPVTAGPADPARAESFRLAGIADHRWHVMVGSQEVGIGTPAQCKALAEELSGDEEKARNTAEWFRKHDAEKKAAVETFHMGRRMFAIIAGSLRVAPPGDARDHVTWFRDAGWASFERSTRGFIDGVSGDVFAYVGSGFRSGPRVRREIVEHLERLGAALDAVVWCGMSPGQAGARWTPLERLGTVRELLAAYRSEERR